eukprot:gene19835-21777_t
MMHSNVKQKSERKRSFLIEDILRDSARLSQVGDGKSTIISAPKSRQVSPHTATATQGCFQFNWNDNSYLEAGVREPSCSCHWQQHPPCLPVSIPPPPLLGVPSPKFPCACLGQPTSSERPTFVGGYSHSLAVTTGMPHSVSPLQFVGEARLNNLEEQPKQMKKHHGVSNWISTNSDSERNGSTIENDQKESGMNEVHLSIYLFIIFSAGFLISVVETKRCR